MDSHERGRRMQIYLGATEPCPYLEGRTARNAFIDPEAPLSPTLYGRLLALGLRRSGGIVYRPMCPGCNACESLRIPVDVFRPRRRHRRCLRAGEHLAAHVLPGDYHDEHYELFRRYVDARHPGGGMSTIGPADYAGFAFAPWCDTELMELRDGDRLVAVAITDRTPDALSAVYTFFDPAYGHLGPGTLAILRQIRRAQGLGRPWLYLGYWIAEAPTMCYKSGFTPHERFGPDGDWHRHE
ncbi:arginyltransferase [Arhodomonas sp. SL1]|uniref:arginyltransferase n=1 Tax=Arhodomonas sp. SL1 TaxID=3425691 RepID=UPI003F884B8F